MYSDHCTTHIVSTGLYRTNIIFTLYRNVTSICQFSFVQAKVTKPKLCPLYISRFVLLCALWPSAGCRHIRCSSASWTLLCAAVCIRSLQVSKLLAQSRNCLTLSIIVRNCSTVDSVSHPRTFAQPRWQPQTSPRKHCICGATFLALSPSLFLHEAAQFDDCN